ncbi:hypothetical protein EYS14_03590 [Alteromonadaceae bacterium M269]|nr:hypothetical protein EYS14_03590 [Alteromonadaceae bacterium M269]
MSNFPLIELNVTNEALAALKEKYASVPDVTTKEGYKVAKAAVSELTKLRTGLEKKRKELKQPYLDQGKAIDDEAKRIKAALEKIETPIREAKKVEDDRLKKLEEERIANIESKMSIFDETLRRANSFDATSESISVAIDYIDKLEVTKDVYQEYYLEALKSKDKALNQLSDILPQVIQREIEHQKQQEQIAALEAQNKANEQIIEKHSVVEPANDSSTAASKHPKQITYTPLQVWPSDLARAENDDLNDVCEQLEEAEEYIQFLLAKKEVA